VQEGRKADAQQNCCDGGITGEETDKGIARLPTEADRAAGFLRISRHA
jgi:hypothetical protein